MTTTLARVLWPPNEVVEREEKALNDLNYRRQFIAPKRHYDRVASCG